MSSTDSTDDLLLKSYANNSFSDNAVLSIAFHRVNGFECLQNQTFPPVPEFPCTRGGQIWLSYLHFFMGSIFNGVRYRINFVDQFDMVTPNDTNSIVGSVVFNESQLTEPVLTLTPRRTALLPNWLGPVSLDYGIVVYRKDSFHRRLTIFHLTKLYPLRIFIPLISVTTIKFAVRRWTLRHHQHQEIIEQPSGPDQKRRQLFWSALVSTVLSLCQHVSFGVFRSHLVRLYGLPTHKRMTIRNFPHLIQLIRSGVVRPITNTGLTLRRIRSLRDKWPIVRELSQALSGNPMRLHSPLDMFQLMSEPGSPYVAFIGSIFLFQFKAHVCPDLIHVLRDDSSPFQLNAMYSSLQIRKRVSISLFKIFEKECAHLGAKYETLPTCKTDVTLEADTLSFVQMWGSWFSIGVLLIVDSFTLIVERTFDRFGFFPMGQNNDDFSGTFTS